MKISKEIREWIILAVVFGGLYLTGLHTEVLGFLQRGVIATGIIRPDISSDYGQIEEDFILEDSNGTRISFSDLEGQTVFINLWATWCPPCIAEMPDIHELYEETKGDVTFLMVSRDREEEKAKAWIERRGYEFPVYFLRSRLPNILQTQAIPTTFVVDPAGKIVVKNAGMAKYNTKAFREFLTSL